MPGFRREAGLLRCDGVSLDEAADRFGTPLYLYSRSAIETAFEAYDQAFSGHPHRICYAVKANGSGAILRLLAELGAGADIVSGMELRAALRAGFRPELVVFSGVGKTEAELRLGLETGIGDFNAESEEEIHRLSRLAGELAAEARVTLRVNPDIDPRSHPYISTGLRENKFGVDIAEAPGIVDRTRRLPGVRLIGLQCHIGSQIADLAPVEEAVRAVAGLSSCLLEGGLVLETIDIGGGLAVDYEGRGTPGPADLAARILPHIEGLPLTLLLEPGRSLVGAAGVLLTRVLYVKQSRDKTFVVVDAGMNDLLRPSLYQAYHAIEPVQSRDRAARTVDVVGPVCESSDFLARDRSLETVEPGELLAVRDTGAYGFCMSSSYNLRPRAAEVLVDQTGLRLVRRRETFEDLTATETAI